MGKEKTTSGRNRKAPRRCQYCGTGAPLVWVHGHGQCAACGITVEECCQGEQYGSDLRKDKGL